MKVRLADYLVEFLAKKGVVDSFSVTGGGAMHLNDAFGKTKLVKTTFNHHEQACAIAAEGYARLTNKMPVVCVTTGPGGINALNGVMGAWVDSIPMFVVSGQVKRATTISSTNLPLRQLGDQEFNIVDCVQCMTKYAVMVNDPLTIAYHLEKAFFLAMNNRKGPVWLDIPLDVQSAVIETENLQHFDVAAAEKEYFLPVLDTDIQAVIERIKAAKKPVIYAGTGIRLAGCHDEFIKLVDKLDIPVVTPWNGHDLIWNSHPDYCGRPGIMGDRGGNFVVQNSDLILALGCRLSIRQVSYNWENFAPHAYKIMVDADAAELKKPTLKIDLPIHANVKTVIDKLNLQLEGQTIAKHNDWLNWAKAVNERYPICKKEYYDVVSPINPYVFLDQFFAHLYEEDIIVASNGSACVCTFQAANLKKGQRLFHNSGCASMGYGLPAAIGVAVATKGKKIFCLEGDGSLQMNIQELQTLVHNRFNITMLVFNNNGYHSIRQTQTNLFKPPLFGVSPDTGVSFPDLEKISNAYGISFVRFSNIHDLEQNLGTEMWRDGPRIIEIIVDKNQNFSPKLSAKVLPDGTIVSPPLEDMYPFLDKEEMQKNYIDF